MRYIFAFILLNLSITVQAQTNYAGSYQNFFGSTIYIRPDSTFLYTWYFDLQASWTKGRWFVVNDTVFFKMVPIYDTLIKVRPDGSFSKSSVLSLDTIPQTTTLAAFNDGASGGQNHHELPGKLFYKGNKLYYISKDGTLARKKVKSFWTNRKVVPWYIRITEEN